MSGANGGPLDGWAKTTLGAIGTYINGRAFKTSEWGKTGRPIIRIQDLTGSNRQLNYFEGEVDERHVVRPGDLLISWSATLGAYIWDGPEGVLNQHIFKVASRIDKKFHYHLVRNVIQDLERNAHGSGMVHVTKGVFDSTPVLLPPAEQQRRIAALLGEIETRRTSIAERVAAARGIVERLRGAVLGAACSGRLTADWREHRYGADEGVAQSVGVTGAVDDGADTYFEIPERWRWHSLGTISDVRGGIQKKPDRAPRSNAYPYVRVANVQRGRLDLAEIAEFELFDGELEKYALRSGDLLVVEGNGSLSEIGRAALWHGGIANCVHQNHLIRVRPTQVLPEYLELFWNSPIGAREIADLAVTTAGLYNLSVSKVSSVPVPVPPTDEQDEVVRRAVAALSVVDRLSVAVAATRTALDRMAHGALARAFRGELVPTDADLADAAL